MSEAAHGAALMRWVRMQEVAHPELKLFFHVPNGGARAKRTAWQLKQEGVKSGVPDYWLPVPRRGLHGLVIELKNDKPKGVLSPEQKTWLEALAGQGFCACVCYGWTEAMDVLTGYLA